MKLSFSAALLLAGCHAQADPVVEAKACVAKIVPAGAKTSAAKARSAVAACQKRVVEWTNASMRHACSGDCDNSNDQNVKEFRDRKAAIEEILLTNMSDEIQPHSVRM